MPASPLLEHVALLATEGCVVAVLFLLLYHARGQFGLAPLYVVFGVMYEYAVVLGSGIYIRFSPLLLIGPGSSVLVPAAMFLVLLVYVTEDALEARKLIYAVAAANIFVLPLSLLVSQQLRLPLVEDTHQVARQVFSVQPRVSIVGSITLLLDTLLIVLVYEAVSRYTRSLFLRIYLSLALTLCIDSVLFVTGEFIERPTYVSILASQIVGKVLVAVIFAIALTIYLRYFTAGQVVVQEGRALGTTLRVLTYRQRYEELQQVVYRDALTGLYNRHFFDAALARQIDLARASGQQLTMLMVDIDFFKKINDTRGHLEGDRVLQDVATTLAATFRASDVVCRYGGDEFAVLLPATDRGHATSLARRLIHVIPERSSYGDGTVHTAVTVTIGLASFPVEAADEKRLVELADERLYAGKHAGRNRIVA